MAHKTKSSSSDTQLTTRVLRLRLKDRHDSYLTGLSREVNFVWNFCNEHSLKVLQREQRFCSAYDIHPYLKGAAKEGLGLHSQTLQAIAEEYVTRRRQFKKSKLRWRVSTGSRRSLGWIPFKASALRYRNGQVFLGKQALSLWDSYGLSNYEMGPGNISQDARGRWYLNITVKVRKAAAAVSSDVKARAIGIDLGLKSLMADSEGNRVEAQRFYRGLEAKLAVAQRAHRVRRVRAIHARIANRRQDALHKLSTAQVRAHRAIFVGDVNAQALARTSMAKSVLDAGWSAYRTMLKYKSDDAGVWFKEVNESYSTQECSCCSACTGPKGRQELHVRAAPAAWCTTGTPTLHASSRRADWCGWSRSLPLQWRREPVNLR